MDEFKAAVLKKRKYPQEIAKAVAFLRGCADDDARFNFFVALPKRIQLDLWANGDWDVYLSEEDPITDEAKQGNERIHQLQQRVRRANLYLFQCEHEYDSERDEVVESNIHVSDYDFDQLRDAAVHEQDLVYECQQLRKKIKILHAAVEWCGQKAGCEHPPANDEQAWSQFLEKQLLP